MSKNGEIESLLWDVDFGSSTIVQKEGTCARTNCLHHDPKRKRKETIITVEYTPSKIQGSFMRQQLSNILSTLYYHYSRDQASNK